MAALIDSIDSPDDLKALDHADLEQLADEIRHLLIDTVSRNGGHLASNLGVIELSIALHRVFSSPRDSIIWDVGHQAYVHKILTGRRQQFSSLRLQGGLSGFPVRAESPHDAFGGGHAGTSVSAALGMALARDLKGENNQIIAVVGDGALTAGVSFEAINHAGHLGNKMIVVLNDNGLSISPSIGAVARLLNLVTLDYRYEMAKKAGRKAADRLPLGKFAWRISKNIKDRLHRALLRGTFWLDLGFTYIGPIDGHNISALETALKRARDYETKPVIVHVLTQKGKGYAPAEENTTEFHGISPNNKKIEESISYSQLFGQTLVRLMKENKKLVAISAAMLDGTGMNLAAQEFPDRVFDVGICEQHAVTLAAGLATQGLVPIVGIYSTFLQRAYDQIIHDVCIQKLPVVFAIDRAGIVGGDGKTHQGPFDISYLSSIPNMIVAAPKDGNEFQQMLFTATMAGQPMAVRYPRGSARKSTPGFVLQALPIGKAEVLRSGDHLAILAIGDPVSAALEAAEMLANDGVNCTVVNARFAKPIDSDLILNLAAKTGRLLVIEENTLSGGFGSAVLKVVSESSLEDVQIKCLGLPDEFIEHASQDELRTEFGLDADGIARSVKNLFSGLPVSVVTELDKGSVQ